MADVTGLPLGIHLTSANHAEVTLAESTVATVREPRPRGKPKSHVATLVADRAYGSGSPRRWLRHRGAGPRSPTKRRPEELVAQARRSTTSNLAPVAPAVGRRADLCLAGSLSKPACPLEARPGTRCRLLSMRLHPHRSATGSEMISKGRPLPESARREATVPADFRTSARRNDAQRRFPMPATAPKRSQTRDAYTHEQASRPDPPDRRRRAR